MWLVWLPPKAMVTYEPLLMPNVHGPTIAAVHGPCCQQRPHGSPGSGRQPVPLLESKNHTAAGTIPIWMAYCHLGPWCCLGPSCFQQPCLGQWPYSTQGLSWHPRLLLVSHLRPHWCLRAKLQLGPYRPDWLVLLPTAMVTSGPELQMRPCLGAQPYCSQGLGCCPWLVTIEGLADARDLGCHLGPCWCLRVMFLLGPQWSEWPVLPMGQWCYLGPAAAENHDWVYGPAAVRVCGSSRSTEPWVMTGCHTVPTLPFASPGRTGPDGIGIGHSRAGSAPCLRWAATVAWTDQFSHHPGLHPGPWVGPP